jgi:predicted SAM-dependent methyltransferase
MTKGVTKFLHSSRTLVPSSLRHLYRQSIRRLRLSQKRWHPAAKQLHLGCGGNLLSGWANVDLEAAAGVIQHDLTEPLPLPPETVKFIYSEHFIEHITRGQALGLLRECQRVLTREGVIRLSTPNLTKLVDEYLAYRTTEWADVDWHPSTPCQMVNEGMRLWGHQFVYDLDELTLLLGEAGFEHVTQVAWRESRHPELKGLECRPFHGEIIVEAVKCVNA